MSKVFFTADTHFDHTNIIRFCDRPFPNVDEMNERLIEKWNAKVRPNDTVYHLGDFAFKTTHRRTCEFTSRLNGNIHLIRGNHDHYECGFVSVSDMKMVRVGPSQIFLCHYPMRTWRNSYHGSLMFYGHVHGKLPNHYETCDVGVDNWGYEPVSYDEIRAVIDTAPSWFKGEDLK